MHSGYQTVCVGQESWIWLNKILQFRISQEIPTKVPAGATVISQGLLEGGPALKLTNMVVDKT